MPAQPAGAPPPPPPQQPYAPPQQYAPPQPYSPPPPQYAPPQAQQPYAPPQPPPQHYAPPPPQYGPPPTPPPMYPPPAVPYGPPPARAGNQNSMIIGLLVIAGAVGVYFYMNNQKNGGGGGGGGAEVTPKDAVEKARAAYLQKDLPTFEKYVDVASVLTEAINQAQQAGTLDASQAEAVKGQMAGIVVAVKRLFFAQGEAAPPPQTQEEALAAGVAQGIYAQVENWTFKGIVSESREGDDGLVVVQFSDPSKAEPYTVRLKSKKAGDHWQVVGAMDMPNMK